MANIAQKILGARSTGNLSLEAGITPVSGSSTGNIFYSFNNKFSASSNLNWNEENKRLFVNTGTNKASTINTKVKGSLSSDKSFSIFNQTETFPLFEVTGNGTFTFRGLNGDTVGNNVRITNNTSYDARIELMSGSSVKTSIWNDMSSGASYINMGFNIYHPGVVGVATAKINNILSTGLAPYGPGYGFNWAFTSNADGYFSQSDRAMWLTSSKSLAMYSGTPASNAHGDLTDAFEMYSYKINEVFLPHFKCSNGDIIKLMKQDWSTVTTVPDIISKLQNLGF